ncbi:hypothetical protein T484DRAFT_1880538, partial [Baffinella frigidus]
SVYEAASRDKEEDPSSLPDSGGWATRGAVGRGAGANRHGGSRVSRSLTCRCSLRAGRASPNSHPRSQQRFRSRQRSRQRGASPSGRSPLRGRRRRGGAPRRACSVSSASRRKD